MLGQEVLKQLRVEFYLVANKTHSAANQHLQN